MTYNDIYQAKGAIERAMNLQLDGCRAIQLHKLIRQMNTALQDVVSAQQSYERQHGAEHGEDFVRHMQDILASDSGVEVEQILTQHDIEQSSAITANDIMQLADIGVLALDEEQSDVDAD